MLLELLREGDPVTETGQFGDIFQGIAFVGRVFQQEAGFPDPVFVDQSAERFMEMFVDDTGYIRGIGIQ